MYMLNPHHVIVKLWPGKSEQQKARLADKIAIFNPAILAAPQWPISTTR